MKPGNKVPRTTHGTYGWLGPIYDYMDALGSVVTPSGASGIPNAIWAGKTVRGTMVSNATGLFGLYGSTGILRPTGLGASGGTTGASGFDLRSNGGTGTQFYTLTDLVAILKSRGDITT